MYLSQSRQKKYFSPLVDDDLIINKTGAMANIETKPQQNLILMGGGGNEAESFKLPA